MQIKYKLYLHSYQVNENKNFFEKYFSKVIDE